MRPPSPWRFLPLRSTENGRKPKRGCTTSFGRPISGLQHCYGSATGLPVAPQSKGRRMTILPPAEPHSERDALLDDLAAAEAALCRHPPQRFLAVRRPEQQHPEGPSSERGVQSGEVHSLNLLIDVVERGILTQIVDRGCASRLEHPVDLVESADRVGEVLERGHANDVVETGVRKRHLRRVPVAKVDLHARPSGVFARDPDERAADVQAGDLMAPALRDLDREEPRSRRDLEHPATWWNRVRDYPSDGFESAQVAAGIAVVPVGD